MSDGGPGRARDGGGDPTYDLDRSEKLIYEVESSDGQWSLARWEGFDEETGVTLLQLEDRISGLKAAKFSQRAPDRWSTVVSVGSDGFALGQVVHPARGIENRRRPGSTFPRGIITTIEAQPGDVGGILANSSAELVGMLAFTLVSSGSEEKRGDTGYDSGGEPRRSEEDGSMAVGKRGWLEEVGTPPHDKEEVGVAVVAPLREGTALGRVVAIPADLLARIARDLKRWGHVKRGALGATFRFHHPSRSSHHHFGVGAAVVELVTEGTAIGAGLVVGDLVQKIDSRVIASPSDLLWFRERVEYGKIGEILNLSVARMDQRRVVTKTIRVPIGQRPGESPQGEASENSAEDDRRGEPHERQLHDVEEPREGAVPPLVLEVLLGLPKLHVEPTLGESGAGPLVTAGLPARLGDVPRVNARQWIVGSSDVVMPVAFDGGHLAAAPDGSVLMTDSVRGVVQRFAPDGSLLEEWSALGEATFQRPAGIFMDDTSGRLFITDIGAGVVYVFHVDVEG